MTSGAPVRPALGIVRCGLVALSVLGLIGAGTELAAGSGEHVVPWTGLAMLAAAVAMFVVPSPRSMLVVRLLTLVVLAAAATGVVEHLMTTADAAGINASTGGDQEDTHLAPGLLGQAALLLLLATLGRRSPPTNV